MSVAITLRPCNGSMKPPLAVRALPPPKNSLDQSERRLPAPALYGPPLRTSFMKKPSRAPFYTIIGLLVLVGLTTAWMRHAQMEIPFIPGVQKPVWLIEARIDFDATGEPVTARLGLPDDPPGYRSFSEQAAA